MSNENHGVVRDAEGEGLEAAILRLRFEVRLRLADDHEIPSLGGRNTAGGQREPEGDGSVADRVADLFEEVAAN